MLMALVVTVTKIEIGQIDYNSLKCNTGLYILLLLKGLPLLVLLTVRSTRRRFYTDFKLKHNLKLPTNTQ